MNHISVLNLNELGNFAPMLAGALDGGIDGTPVLLGYTKENKALGALAAVQMEELIILRWIVVEEEAHRQGIGSQLLNALYKYAVAKKINEIDAVVCLSGEENEVAKSWLMRNGFQMTEQNKMFSIPVSAIMEGPLASHIKKPRHSNIAVFSEVSKVQLQEFNLGVLSTEGQPDIDASEILADCSFAWLENGKITGCILLASCNEDVEIQWFYGKNPLMVQEMILAMAESLVDKYSDETRIYAAAMQSSVESMIRKLAGDRLKEEQTIDLYQCLF